MSSFLHRRPAAFLFGILQPLFCYFVFYHFQLNPSARLYFVTYVAIALICYFFISAWRFRSLVTVGAFLVALLVFNRCAGVLWTFADFAIVLGPWAPPFLGLSGLTSPVAFVGFSYFCFRLILAALELRQNRDWRPRLTEFLGFAFFLPHLLVGPITPYQCFQSAYHERRRRDLAPILTAVIRIALGFTKFYFISGLFFQLTLTRSAADPSFLTWGHLILSAFAYTMFMYFNFSGFCDVMIGTSYLCGIESKENFDSPLFATNLRDYWRRWHMSLTEFLQMMIFNPLMKLLARQGLPFGLCLVIATYAVFIVMGLWHGFYAHFMIFSLLHASGLIFTHYWPATWTLPRGLSWALTFSFITFCFFFFENNVERIHQIMTAVTK